MLEDVNSGVERPRYADAAMAVRGHFAAVCVSSVADRHHGVPRHLRRAQSTQWTDELTQRRINFNEIYAVPQIEPHGAPRFVRAVDNGRGPWEHHPRNEVFAPIHVSRRARQPESTNPHPGAFNPPPVYRVAKSHVRVVSTAKVP